MLRWAGAKNVSELPSGPSALRWLPLCEVADSGLKSRASRSPEGINKIERDSWLADLVEGQAYGKNAKEQPGQPSVSGKIEAKIWFSARKRKSKAHKNILGRGFPFLKNRRLRMGDVGRGSL